MSKVTGIITKLDNYIEYAEARNVVSDVLFYQEIRSLLKSHVVLDKETAGRMVNLFEEVFCVYCQSIKEIDDTVMHDWDCPNNEIESELTRITEDNP